MPPESRLDRETVVQTAAHLINTEGMQSLTLSRLARELSIRTPSLYNHIDGLPGLLRELALLNARSLAQVMKEAVIGKSGVQAIYSLSQAYRSYIKTYPGQYLISLPASGNLPEPDPELEKAEAQAVQVVQAVLAGFQLVGNDNLHAIRGLRSLVHGFATLEVAGGFGLPLDCDESFRRLVEMYIYSLEHRAKN